MKPIHNTVIRKSDDDGSDNDNDSGSTFHVVKQIALDLENIMNVDNIGRSNNNSSSNGISGSGSGSKTSMTYIIELLATNVFKRENKLTSLVTE